MDNNQDRKSHDDDDDDEHSSVNSDANHVEKQHESNDDEEEEEEEEEEHDTRTFAELGISEWLVQTCNEMGINRPSYIQHLCIPSVLEGKNVVGRAKTGSGKTAAFALPIIQELSNDPYGTFALVLTPTHELAFQIAHQFRAFGVSINLTDSVVVGGMDMLKQMGELADRPHVVIATPGRLAQLIDSNCEVHFDYLRYLVLDEADRLFEESFANDIATILTKLPPPQDRQTLLFSATMTPSLARLQTLALGNGEVSFCDASKSDHSTVSQLKQQYLFLPQLVKECYLVHLLQNRVPPSCSTIVFTSTCRTCQVVAELLTVMEIDCVSLHSRKSQSRRMASLGKFRSGQSQVLVATDVASRGLDIPTVQFVVNYDVPRDAHDYVHRVGRTARAGRGGLALTLITQHDIVLFEAIEKLINAKMGLYPVNEDMVLQQLKKVNSATRMAMIRLEEYEQKNPSPHTKRKQARASAMAAAAASKERRARKKRRKNKGKP